MKEGQTEIENGGSTAPINALTASQNVLDSFWNLAVDDEERRISAAKVLLDELIAGQREHEESRRSKDGSLNNLPPDVDKLPKPKRQELALRRCSPLMIYALRRLVRGLGSGREGARQGFATALTLLLSKEGQPAASSTFMDAEDVMILIETCLEVSSTVKAGEARDILVGKLFGFGALVRSGVMLCTTEIVINPPSAIKASTKAASKGAAGSNGIVHGSSLSPSTLSTFSRCTRELLDLAKAKTFLREASIGVLIELMQAIGPQASASLYESCPELRAFVSSPTAQASPESLCMALFLWPILPQEAISKIPLLPSSSDSSASSPSPRPPVSLFFPRSSSSGSSSSSSCLALLWGTDHFKSLLPSIQGSITSNPRLHTLWTTCLLPLMLPPQDLPTSDITAPAPAPAQRYMSVKQLETFWTLVVEEGLLVSPSHERKFLALRLLQAFLPRLEATQIPVILSKSILKVLGNNIRNKDNFLHAAAKRCVDSIASFVKGEGGGDVRMAVIAAMKRNGGSGLLQQDSKSSTAAGADKTEKGAVDPKKKGGLVVDLGTLGIKTYLSQMMTSFLKAGTEPAEGGEGEKDKEAGAETRRSYCIEQLVSAVKMPSADPSDVARALRFLATHGLLEIPSTLPGSIDGEAPTKQSAKKKGKAANIAKEAPGPPVSWPQEVVDASKLVVPVSASTRVVCAQRLVALSGYFAPHRLAAIARKLKSKPPGGKAAAATATAAASTAAATATAAAKEDEDSKPAAADDLFSSGASLVQSLMDLVHSCSQWLVGGSLGSDDDVSLTVLREIEKAAREKLKVAGPVSFSASGTRGLLHLTRLLQLMALCDHVSSSSSAALRGEAAPGGGAGGGGLVDTQLVMGLRRIAREGPFDLSSSLEELKVDANAMEEDEEDEEEEKEASWQDVMVDVFLSLLSRSPSSSAGSVPTSTLREAVEALWRTLCDSLTEGGMKDLVRVLAPSSAAGGQDGIFEEEGEEEEEVEEVEEEDDDDDDDDDEEDEEEEEEKEEKKVKSSKKQKSDQDDKDKQEEEEEEDEEDDDVDDEAMFRMEGKIAAYLRGMVDARRGAKDRAQALSHLKLRALSLLEIFAKRSPNSPLLPLALAPLSLALVLARRKVTPVPSGPPGKGKKGGRPTPSVAQDSPLSTRLLSLFNAVCPSGGRPPLPPLSSEHGGRLGSSSLEEVRAALSQTLGIASREKDRVVAQVAGRAWVLTLRLAEASDTLVGASEAAADSFKTGMMDLLTKKKCRLHRTTLEEATKSAPLSSLSSLPLLLSKCCPSELTSKHSSSSAAVQAPKGGQKEGRALTEGLQLLAALLRPPTLSSQPQASAGAGKGQDPPTGYPAHFLEAVKENKAALLSALTAAVVGPLLSSFGGGKDAHINCLKAAAGAMERLRSGFKGKRMVEVLGQEGMAGVAKAVVTLQDVLDPIPMKISTQIDRLLAAAGISEDLISKTTVDVALKGRLVKSRAKMEEQRTEKKGVKRAHVKEEKIDDDEAPAEVKQSKEGKAVAKDGSKSKKVKVEADASKDVKESKLQGNKRPASDEGVAMAEKKPKLKKK